MDTLYTRLLENGEFHVHNSTKSGSRLGHGGAACRAGICAEPAKFPRGHRRLHDGVAKGSQLCASKGYGEHRAVGSRPVLPDRVSGPPATGHAPRAISGLSVIIVSCRRLLNFPPATLPARPHISSKVT